jgi:hypothetical protein
MAGKNVTIGNVNIAMSANAAQLIQQAQKANKGWKKNLQAMLKVTKKFSKDVKSATKNVAKFGAVAGSTVAAGVGVLAVKMFEAQREAQRMSDIAGITMERFSEMTHVTNSLGLQTEYLADGMKDLNVRIVDAAKGGGTMVDFFNLMGQKASDWIDLDPAQQLDKFIELTGKLGDNEAKFWADEVNDSMYRLGVTLRRSGTSIQEFMAEARSFGAGTSTLFIGQVNEMYNSFARLRIIAGELVKTTLSVLAPAFTKAFDSMSTELKDLVSDGENTSKGIFNISKQIATWVLTSLQEMYVGIKSFTTKIQLLLGKIDSNFSIGLLSQEQIDRLQKVDAEISKIKENIKKGGAEVEHEAFLGRLFGVKQFEGLKGEALKQAEDTLRALVKKRDEILADAGNDPVSSTFAQLLGGLDNQTFEGMKSSPSGGATTPTKNSPQDPAVLKEARDYLKQFNSEAGKLTDSTLVQLSLDKKRLETLQKHYELLREQGVLGAEKTKDEIDASKALEDIEKKRQDRLKEMANERKKARIEEYNEMLQLHQAHLQARQQFDEQYGDSYQAMSEAQVALEQIRLSGLLQQGIINQQEFADAIVQLQQDRINSEVQMEMQKASVLLNGMQAFFGESQGMARAAFAFQQGMALQQVLMNQYQAVAAVWADQTLPWYAKAGATVLAAAEVGAQYQQIKSMGQFHNGGQIPYDGTYYMEGGEMVIPKDTVKDFVANTAAMGESQGGSGGGTVIHSTIQMGPSLVDEKVFAAALQKQQTTLATLVNKEQKKRPTRNRSKR